ncbi:MAG: glycine cleavage system protein H, partial [Candidatus Fonsibacter sp.]
MTEKRYTKKHEWIEVNGNSATIGITSHATTQ